MTSAMQRQARPTIVFILFGLPVMQHLQDRCENLQGEVDRLTAERDKLMDIGNGLRAELNRALSSSYQVHDRRPSTTRSSDFRIPGRTCRHRAD